jgi:hypothetical protein
VGIGLALLLASSALHPGSAQAATSGTLNVNMTSAVAGWTLTFSGKSPVSGTQRVTLQRFLNGAWHDRMTVTTDSTGAFRMRAKQQAMPTEHYRVRGAGFVTRQVDITGIDQDVMIQASGGIAMLGTKFNLAAAVTPAQAGRTVQFFHANNSGGWDVIGEATTDARGIADIETTGTGRFMALAKSYQGACSYPSLVLTRGIALNLDLLSILDPESSVILSPQPSSVHFAAERTYTWWPAGETWGWESGEEIDDWSTHQTGSGNLTTFIGMLSLLSGSYNNSIPSYGTTATTLANEGHATGRWEMRVKQKSYGSTPYTPYTIQLRLVRAGTGYQAQPEDVITVAEWRGYSGVTRHSVTKQGLTYSYPSSGTHRNHSNFHNYAIELTSRHLTWLLDGEVIATAPAAMLPTGNWVPQVVLKGKDGVRMTTTRVGADWVRYFPLGNPRALRLPIGPAPTL